MLWVQPQNNELSIFYNAVYAEYLSYPVVYDLVAIEGIVRVRCSSVPPLYLLECHL